MKVIFISVFIFLILILLYYVFPFETFNEKNNYSKCLGKRNGVSGCRDCCKNKYNSNEYNKCVNSCMDF